jgi:hypothetical protein
MNKFLKSSLILGIILTLNSCGGNSSNNSIPVASSELPLEVQNALKSEKSLLTQELTNTLSYMGNEERLAYDVYNEFYRQYGTKQFTNIATKSEYKHITAVQDLVKKYLLSDDINFTNIDAPSLGYMNTAIENMNAGIYDISLIQALYDDLIAKGSASEIEALKVGCIIEVTDVEDLNKDIILAENEKATDIVTVFNFLRDGSYNHYWSFDKGLKNKGVTNGCCSLGSINGVNYCHPEYPQK